MMLTVGLHFAILVAGWLTIGALQRRGGGAGPRAFAFLGLCIALWSTGELLAMNAATDEARVLARRTFFLGAAALPPVWFWLASGAARPGWRHRRPWLVVVGFAAPAFFYSCLYWDRDVRFVDWAAQSPTHGPWFDLFLVHQYFLCLAGTFYFSRAALRLRASDRYHVALFTTGVALPLVTNLLYWLDVVETDWTVVALGPAALLVWLGAMGSGLITSTSDRGQGVIEQLDVGVIVADVEGRILSANAAAERLAELSPLRGRLLPEAVAAAEQRPEAIIESRGIALRNRFGTTGHALILTDRTEAETSRRRLELGGRLEALGSLTAGIAHEVNNPLAFIQANLCSLESTAKALSNDCVAEALPGPLQEAVDDMAALVEETQEGVERIRFLVQRLKSFSRNPDLTATAVEVDLAHAVRQAAAVATIGQNGEPIRIVGEDGLRVRTIETAVFQVLVNLLLNAVQASPDAPCVTVELDRNGGGVSLRVLDDGPGISAGLLPRIFDPFFTTKPTGTGLGLSLSYDLARQLGGHLSVANREGGGAVFELWLPNEPPERARAEEGVLEAPVDSSPWLASEDPASVA